MSEQQSIQALNELLKGEQMAINIYDKTKTLQGDEQVSRMLDQFQKDHEQHAKELNNRIRELGGKPETATGFAGIMSSVSAIVNSLLGPGNLLKQVYNGEDKGVHAYEDRLDNLDPTSQELVRTMINTDHEHLKLFKERMEKEEMRQH